MKLSMSLSNSEITNRTKEYLIGYLDKELKGIDDVGLLLSGGIDSKLMLFMLNELGKNIHIYSCHIEGYESKDFITAKKLYNDYHCSSFNEVILPLDVNSLQKDVLSLINDEKMVKKSDIECMWVVTKIFQKIKEDNKVNVVIDGMCGDSFFGLTKRAAIHYSKTPELFKEYRLQELSEDTIQMEFMNSYSERLGFKSIHPFYNNKDLIEPLFDGKLWKEVNKPKVKLIYFNMYPQEYSKYYYKHQNFQKGDTKILDVFKQLMKTNWGSMVKGKTVVSIYNAIKKGKITE